MLENGMVTGRGYYGVNERGKHEPSVLGICPHCGRQVTDAHVYGRWEDEYFCDQHCFLGYMGYWEVG